MKAQSAFLLIAALSAPGALAEPAPKEPRHYESRLSAEERRQLREDVHETYRNRERGARGERPRPLSAQEREKLRGDILDADQALRRRQQKD